MPSFKISLYELADAPPYARSFDDVYPRHRMPIAVRVTPDVAARTTEVEHS